MYVPSGVPPYDKPFTFFVFSQFVQNTTKRVEFITVVTAHPDIS